LIAENVPALAEGVYSVRWKAVSLDDGFVAEGEFDFIIGKAAPRLKPTPAATATALPPQPTSPPSVAMAALTADPIQADPASESRAWSPMVIAAGIMLAVALLLVLKGDQP
jgi:hypothetical protein